MKLKLAIKRVIGPSDSGQGRSNWIWPLDANGETLWGSVERNRIIEICKKSFDCYQSVRVFPTGKQTLLLFPVHVKGTYLGYFVIRAPEEAGDEDIVALNYHGEPGVTEEQIHEFYRTREGTVSYEKVN